MIDPIVLLDTNILVYAYDEDSPAKMQTARSLLAQMHANDVGALSTQVLGEFYVAVMRRFETKLSPAEVASHTRLWADTFPVFDTTAEVVAEALRGVEHYCFSYYDAQIWAIARLNRIPFVLTEDFNGGCTIEGVQFVNPFVGEFDLGPVLAE